MGCAVSRKIHRQLSLDIGNRQLALVKMIWEEVNQHREVTGVSIYKYLLKSEKDLRRLFPKVVCEDNVERFTIDEENLRRHALRVMEGMDFAVGCLDDHQKLDRFLRMVGARHYEAGVPQEVLQKFWPALDEAFAGVLKDEYPRDARNAWHFFFHYMINVMKIGMIEAEMKDMARDKRKLSD